MSTKTEMWAVVALSGAFVPGTNSGSENNSQYRAMIELCEDDWAELVVHGYRAVRVTVTPVEG